MARPRGVRVEANPPPRGFGARAGAPGGFPRVPRAGLLGEDREARPGGRDRGRRLLGPGFRAPRAPARAGRRRSALWPLRVFALRPLGDILRAARPQGIRPRPGFVRAQGERRLQGAERPAVRGRGALVSEEAPLRLQHIQARVRQRHD